MRATAARREGRRIASVAPGVVDATSPDLLRGALM